MAIRAAAGVSVDLVRLVLFGAQPSAVVREASAPAAAAQCDPVMVVGPAASIAHVPLRDVLPRNHAAAEVRLRDLALRLDTHRSAVGRTAWHWYPEHMHPPSVGSSRRMYALLLDGGVAVMHAGSDWLELTLDLAWMPGLAVHAAVEVACWCRPDHNMHQVRHAEWPVATSEDLIDGVAAAVAMLTDVLDSGSFDPGPWRIRAGLPDAPSKAAGRP